MNRRCTGEAGSRKLMPGGRCTRLLPFCIIHDLPAEFRLCMALLLPRSIVKAVRCPDTDCALLVTLRCLALLLGNGCNGPCLTLTSLFGPMAPRLTLLTSIAYRRTACRLLAMRCFLPYVCLYITRYRATLCRAPRDRRLTNR